MLLAHTSAFVTSFCGPPTPVGRRLMSTRAMQRAAAAAGGSRGSTPPPGLSTAAESGQHVTLAIKSRGPSPPNATSGGRQTTVTQQQLSKQAFYLEVPQHMRSRPLRSPYDSEIWLLFLPALFAGLLEPIQQTAESILVGKLGVSQLGALGLGTVLFQFAVGFLASLIIATTPRVAAHSDNKALASRATAQGMWVALVLGVALQAAVWAKAPDIITFMSSSDALVASLAVQYLKARSWGLPAAMVMMTAIGAARGVKDMKVQLVGSFAYLVALVGADLFFLFGPPAMGIEGAGYGASVAQWAGAASVCYLLSQKQIFSLRDMASLPALSDIRPYARMTGSLAVNNLSALLPTLVATSAATALGVQHLGAHTILRQLMGFWLQLFIAFNATAHSLIANSISRQREGRAAEILVRIGQLAVAVSLPLAVALFASRGMLPGLFTEDALVQHEVAEVLPFLLILMPLDALGLVLEGGLLGASDTGYLGARTAIACAVSLLVLFIASFTHGSLLAVWVGMKCVNICTLGLDLGKFWMKDGHLPQPPSKHEQ